MIKSPAILPSLLLLCACTPVTANRGNFLDDYEMKSVVVGQDTRDDIIRKIGSPTEISPFDDNTWYYLGQKTEKVGIFDPTVKQERIVVVNFDKDGHVLAMNERKNGREDVPIVSQTTPTSGNEVTFVQQMLGNLGKFNKQDSTNSATTAGGGAGEIPGGR